MKDLDFINISGRKVWCKEGFLYHIRIYHIRIYCSKYKVPHEIKDMYLIFHKINGYVKNFDGIEYSTLIPGNRKDKILLIKFMINLDILFR